MIPIQIYTYEQRKALIKTQVACSQLFKGLIQRRKQVKNVVSSQYDLKLNIQKGGFLCTAKKYMNVSGAKYVVRLREDGFGVD